MLVVEVTELALGLKAEGCAALSGKISSLTSHITYPRVAWGRGAGNVPLQKAASSGASSSLCPQKANVPVAKDASSKGYGNQKRAKPLASPHRGEGQPLNGQCPTSGWWVAYVCRVTRLLRKEVLNPRCCLLGQEIAKGREGVLFCFVSKSQI